MLQRLFRIVAPFLALPFPLVAGQVFVPGSGIELARQNPDYDIQLKQSIDLGDLTQAEILMMFGGESVDEGNWTGSGHLFGGMLNSIVRPLSRIWRYQMWTTGVGDPVSTLNVTYTLFGLNGTLGVLSHVEEPSHEIDVRLNPEPVLVVATTSKKVIMEGGVVVTLDLDGVRLSGQYAGTLVVTLSQF